MYILIAGGGKVGRNLTKDLLAMGHEVTVIERRADRYHSLEEEFEHVVQHGDATELHVLERCGVRRAGLVVAVTGDDEDNIIVCQVARDGYGVERSVARVNDPRNQEAFDLLGIAPTVCATTSIMALIEHELPNHELVKLLSLRREQLEITEIQLADDSPSAGRLVREVDLPAGARLISVMRGGEAEIAVGETRLEPGDQVLAILKPGLEPAVRRALLRA
ncbi:MAG: trk/ktr system potassium uptake protein [Gaiellales bacterium]|nr:trk/ktr system potassium uptake protein [Gaiellales bacterium]